jgi:hypothetical protein
LDEGYNQVIHLEDRVKVVEVILVEAPGEDKEAEKGEDPEGAKVVKVPAVEKEADKDPQI